MRKAFVVRYRSLLASLGLGIAMMLALAAPSYAATDPTVQAGLDGVTGFITNNAVAIVGVILLLAGLGFTMSFVWKKIRHVA